MNTSVKWTRLTSVTAALMFACAPNHGAMSQTESPDSVIAQVEGVIRARYEHIARYTVKEIYSVYRNGATATAAQKAVQVVYQRSSGATYTTISASGSAMLQRQAIEPSLDSDKQVNDPIMRSQILLTSDNYQIQVEPVETSINGQNCIVLDLEARRKSVYLLNGKAWVDAKTYRLVRIQGTQSKSLSLLAGSPLITRDFTNVSGFAMVTHEKIEAHSFLFGRTIVDIDYKDYEVVSDTKAEVR